MKRLGITQRVDVEPRHGEVRDALDQAWTRLLAELEVLPVPLSNAVEPVERYVDALGLEGVILSGGNDLAGLPGARTPSPLRDRFEKALLSHCQRSGLPLLGVCRGMQLLCHEHGFEIVEVEGHVAARHVVLVEPGGRELWPERMEVNSFHRFAVAPVQGEAPLRVLARDEQQRIEAVVHPTLPHYGVMWHPEREEGFRREDLSLFRRVFSL